MSSATDTIPSWLVSQAGQSATGASPSGMLPLDTNSLMATLPLPLQSPAHALGVGVGVGATSPTATMIIVSAAASPSTVVEPSTLLPAPNRTYSPGVAGARQVNSHAASSLESISFGPAWW